MGPRLAKAAAAGARQFASRLGEPFGLSPIEYAVLEVLSAHAALAQCAVSVALGVSAPRLTLVCQRLAARKLIARTRCAADRRKQFVALTPEGARLVEDAAHIAAAIDRDMFICLSQAERSMLFDLLDKVANGR